MIRYLIPLLIVCLMYSCTSDQEKINQMDWLQGTWTREYNGVIQIENWKQQGNNLLGESIYVYENDSTLMSSFRISAENNQLVYRNQEAGFEDSTLYTLRYYSIDSLIFTTHQPIWPQTILLYHTENKRYIKSLTGKLQQMNNFVHFEYLRKAGQ